MFVLDTNVISELMKDRPNAAVLEWMDNQSADALFVTAVTQAEILTGIAILPEGVRKRGLATDAERVFSVYFANRIFPFDSRAASLYASIASERKAAGRPISQADCQIAAIARSRTMSVVTRDVSGFAGCGVGIINPWSNKGD